MARHATIIKSRSAGTGDASAYDFSSGLSGELPRSRQFLQSQTFSLRVLSSFRLTAGYPASLKLANT